MEPIRLYVTGGTFDKEYDEINGKLYFKDTHLPELLKLGKCTLNVEVRTLMMVDSLEMCDMDRQLIAENCQRAERDKIMITHGTDTMVKTASVIAKYNINKTIVLTGALIPYKFGSSDGFFNLGNAMGYVQLLPPGVYIVMNGRYFNWDNVQKNYKTGVFETIHT
ncbi:MAG: asparaginase [Chitinophagaceae bacterium]|nr:MAG: asparaginase [Chitinophagaceae bacterium]